MVSHPPRSPLPYILAWVALGGVACGASQAERAATDPKVFTKVTMRYIVTGKNLDRNKVERAVQLSEEKYCSASAMFRHTAQLSHEIEIVEAG